MSTKKTDYKDRAGKKLGVNAAAGALLGASPFAKQNDDTQSEKPNPAVPALGQPPAEQPPAEQPPAEQPPTEQTPTPENQPSDGSFIAGFAQRFVEEQKTKVRKEDLYTSHTIRIRTSIIERFDELVKPLGHGAKTEVIESMFKRAVEELEAVQKDLKAAVKPKRK